MDGEFGYQRITKVNNIMGLVSGVLIDLILGILLCIGEQRTQDEVIVICFFACFAFFISILCAISLYVNRKAYIHVDDQGISAFCHFGLALKCDFTDVSDVLFGGTGLNIRLKNGKKYNLMNLNNAYQIGKYIRKRIAVMQPASLDKDKMTATLLQLRKRRKYEGITAIICFLLLFPSVFLAEALKNWMELHHFNADDWTVFSIMFGVGFILLVFSCILLRKYLLDTNELTKVQGMLDHVILQTAPVQPGNAIKLYIDDDISATFRLTIYGCPDSARVYSTVERVNKNNEIELAYTSQAYSNIDELTAEVEGMTEIPLP